MLTEEQKKRISDSMQRFRDKVVEFLSKRSELEKCKRNLRIKEVEFSKVAKEERQTEVAMEVLYGEEKKESKIREIEEDIKSWQQKADSLGNDLDQLKTELLRQIHDLPIPADLDNPRKEESGLVFPYFEGTEIGPDGINVLCELLRQEASLDFLGVIILPDKVLVADVSKKEEAIYKLVDGINSLRMHVENILKTYEQIDEMVDRIRKSSQYSAVLKVLAKEGKLSAAKIAAILNQDKGRTYNACYNLTRSNWSPSPIQKTSSGEWELTPPGEILISRLIEKFPEEDVTQLRTGRWRAIEYFWCQP
jgi:hypothetical protein